MIISASRRSDIPAFYGDWFMNRLRAGEVLVRNPMQPKQVSRILLTPETVDAFVFWTKNPEKFLPHLPEIDALGYSYYFLFTLTPYDATLEPGVPEKGKILDLFRQLSRLIGPEKVIWRYDPVVLTDRFTPAWHAETFSRFANELSGYTERCVISFLDEYRKVKGRMRDIHYHLPNTDEMGELAARFADAARCHGMALFTCSYDVDLSRDGIMHSRCIDADLIERISGRQLQHKKKDNNQRNRCGCVESRDIGSYNSCGHGCLYCYAVDSHPKASAAQQCSNTMSPLHCDTLRGDETIVTTRRKIYGKAGGLSGSTLMQTELFE